MAEKPEHKPTPSDCAMADSVDDLVTALMRGEVSGLGVCATFASGQPVYFYLDRTEGHDCLSNPMSKLMGLYAMNQRFNAQITAPRQNRSYLVH